MKTYPTCGYLSKNDLSRFREVLDIPDFIIPWLDRFFNDAEILLVLLVAENPLSIDEIADRWAGDEYYRDLSVLQDFLARCCKRGVVCKCDQDRFQSAEFHERFDSWALFEGWMGIPDEYTKKARASRSVADLA